MRTGRRGVHAVRVSSASVGIDYGTSNTVAVLRYPDGKVRPLLFDSSPLLPSAVFVNDHGHVVVGQDAERSARLDPARFEPHPKRRIDDLDVLLGERAYPVTELVAAGLSRVGGEAARVSGGPVQAVTMTCPATWGSARRQVLLDAAARAGLPKPVLVPEPVAAATYFASVLGHRMRPGQCVVVYDLGAGTFDASVVQRTEDGFRDLSCQGLDDVGGVDLDALVVAHARTVVEPAAPDAWKRLSTPQGTADLRHVTMLWDDARHLREALSREASASMFVPLADVEVLMTREQFETVAGPVLQRTADLTLNTLKQARVRPEDVVGWFLVGGATRTPLVATLLHRVGGMAPTVLEEPQLVVAEGALRIADLTAPPRFNPPPVVSGPSWPVQAPIIVQKARTRQPPHPLELFGLVAAVFAALVVVATMNSGPTTVEAVSAALLVAAVLGRAWTVRAGTVHRTGWLAVVAAGLAALLLSSVVVQAL
jgi:molecular chaperone DnaK